MNQYTRDNFINLMRETYPDHFTSDMPDALVLIQGTSLHPDVDIEGFTPSSAP